METKPLAGKTAVVTGAGRGIGRSFALAFARAGADIAIFARNKTELAEVQAEAQAEGVTCHVFSVDLTDGEATKTACEATIAALGHVDILLNNAGGGMESSLVADSDPERWWKTIELNIKTTYLVTRHLLDGMSEGGKIINMSSGVGLSAGNKNSAYHVAKAGVHLFTQSLANELWPRKIDVNNLIPGPVATSGLTNDKTGKLSKPDAILDHFGGKLPPNFPEWERLKHPDEVAEFALWLASLPVGGPTGQTFSLARCPL